jgi:hypothetical protein
VHSTTTDLYYDATGGSIGVVLQQTDRDGNVRPVGFYSRKLTPAEGRYGTYDRELVGLRDGCLHFRYHLLGVPFTVRTDHGSLRWLPTEINFYSTAMACGSESSPNDGDLTCERFRQRGC